MTLRAIFFDLGGVIVRTEYQAPRERLAERLNMTYEDLGKIVFEAETARKASIGEISVEAHWLAVARKLHLPASEAKAIHAEFFAGDVIDRDLLSFIRSLRPRHKTGVISNAWGDLREYIVKNQFDDAFDTLIISAEIGMMKPEPEVYRLALKQAQVEAAEAAFVDDTPKNVEAADALGMHGILFRDPAQVKENLKALLNHR
ncbi:MAG TPA: HAD family phosphatase [Anaerolineales bacterium]|nr:HAD family phosphatase [Anaerolineales bacterium]